MFSVKLITGLLSNSIAVLSDAFNNLSDCASCMVTLLGCKIAAKPADRSHPFGHGRMEYLTSLFIAVIICVMGIGLFRDSAEKIIRPEDVKLSAVSVILLVSSIGVKLWMSFFNKFLGKKIGSIVLEAVSQDSRNDAVSTFVALVSLLLSGFINAPVDGIAGVLVSLFILKSGYEMIRDIVDEILGKPADPDDIGRIKKLAENDPRIIGVHDIIIHNYGPAKVIGSCHAEICSTESFINAHEAVDDLEHTIFEKLGIYMTIHMDPVAIDDERVDECRTLMTKILKGIDSALSYHDFRIVDCESSTKLVFDLSVPFETSLTDGEIKRLIDERLAEKCEEFETIITFDRY